jgi:hypothetical protein
MGAPKNKFKRDEIKKSFLRIRKYEIPTSK